MSQGTVIAASSRVGGSGTVSQGTAVIPAQTRLVAGQSTILATPARLGTQIVGGQPAVFTATARIASAGLQNSRIAFFLYLIRCDDLLSSIN